MNLTNLNPPVRFEEEEEEEEEVVEEDYVDMIKLYGGLDNDRSCKACRKKKSFYCLFVFEM